MAQRFARRSPRKTLLKLQLLPRWLTSAEFRLAFTSGVSANSACFERELLDHHRLVFEKDACATGPSRSSRAARCGRDRARFARNASSRGRRRQGSRPTPTGVRVEVLAPVIAGDVKRIMYALPSGSLGSLKKNAYVPSLVGHRCCSAEMRGDGGEQLVGPPSRARHVDDDRGERHESRS
jgi:hypothetical protein